MVVPFAAIGVTTENSKEPGSTPARGKGNCNTMDDLARWNRARYRPVDAGGHYESWFQRANHPQRSLAFWIRYTIFSPKGRPEDAVGELWAVVFDGELGRTVAVKETVPIAQCRFSRSDLDARIGVATLNPFHLDGRARSPAHTIRWQLDYAGFEPPLLLLAPRLYEGNFPKAKALVGSPNAMFRGMLAIDGEQIPIDAWQGSQNHNWGSRHTDAYAWGQVAGFDDAPDTFLECSTARLRVGGIRMPPLTPVVLRVDGRELSLNRPLQSLRARGRYDFFDWRIVSKARGVRVSIRFHAEGPDFVALRYDNPPGGAKICLNSKIARAQLTLRRAGATTVLRSSRAAFEILDDSAPPGVQPSA